MAKPKKQATRTQAARASETPPDPPEAEAAAATPTNPADQELAAQPGTTSNAAYAYDPGAKQPGPYYDEPAAAPAAESSHARPGELVRYVTRTSDGVEGEGYGLVLGEYHPDDPEDPGYLRVFALGQPVAVDHDDVLVDDDTDD